MIQGEGQSWSADKATRLFAYVLCRAVDITHISVPGGECLLDWE